ncbi:MAG: alpha/beta fold hydrolase, partial [Actinomycetota bacterium]
SDIEYTIEMMAEDSAGLLRALGVTTADVVGISLGGRIALELALGHPSMVRKLVLVSTSARPYRTWFTSLVFDVIHRLPVLRGSQPRFAFDRQREASSSYDCTNRLPEVSATTLILGGKRDRFSPMELQEELHRKISGSEFQSFNGGHLSFMMGEREKFLEVMESWLEEPETGI